MSGFSLTIWDIFATDVLVFQTSEPVFPTSYGCCRSWHLRMSFLNSFLKYAKRLYTPLRYRGRPSMFANHHTWWSNELVLALDTQLKAISCWYSYSVYMLCSYIWTFIIFYIERVVTEKYIETVWATFRVSWPLKFSKLGFHVTLYPNTQTNRIFYFVLHTLFEITHRKFWLTANFILILPDFVNVRDWLITN